MADEFRLPFTFERQGCVLTIQVENCELLRTALDKCLGLFDCYKTPPVIDGVTMTREYLEKHFYMRNGALVIDEQITGGVFGDIAGQLFDILAKRGVLRPETQIVYKDLAVTYEQFRSSGPQRHPDMAIFESTDDPDSDCFRGRKHLLDMFWEGCIEQSNEWDTND